MKIKSVLLAGVVSMTITSAEADAEGAGEPDATGHTPLPLVAAPPAPPVQAFQPCFGRGYMPYAYPAFGSCPCGDDHCFHPGVYYHGGKPYRREWLCRWIRAHVGHGSMLEAYPCPCISPVAGKPYLISPPAPPVQAEPPFPAEPAPVPPPPAPAE